MAREGQASKPQTSRLGELVEQELAFFVEGFGGDDFAAEVAEVGKPVAEVEREAGR